jgi:FkbM family methyltransferase
MHEDLIFDIGMHEGKDSWFYLEKGFRVVGVEANPRLVEFSRNHFSWWIQQNKLTIENIGIADRDSEMMFYINKQIDEWSSFDYGLATRENTAIEKLKINAKNINYLIDKYGMPYYMKIDIEGFDEFVVRGLCVSAERPRFVSIEDGGIHSLISLYESGVREFKFINQTTIRDKRLQFRRRNGEVFEHTFTVASSGPLAEDLPDIEWLPTEQAFAFYLARVRPPGEPPIDGWWDIHGRYR